MQNRCERGHTHLRGKSSDRASVEHSFFDSLVGKVDLERARCTPRGAALVSSSLQSTGYS